MSRIIRLIAVISAVLVSGIALTDAITQGLTGAASVFTGGGALATAGDIIHAICFGAIVAVLLTVAAPVFEGRPWRQVLRWTLVVAYGVMTIGMMLGALGVSPGLLEVLFNLVFALQLLAPAALGITLLVQGDRSPSAWLLAGTIAAFGLMFALGATAPAWAHPAYTEVLADVGLALVGVGSTAAVTARRAAEPAPVV